MANDRDVTLTIRAKDEASKSLQKIGDEALDYKGLGGYEMFTEEEEAVFRQCLDRLPDFNEKIGAITGRKSVYSVVDDRLPSFGFRGIRHLLLNEAEGQVNTGKMMAALLQKAREAGIEVCNGLVIKHLEDTSRGVELETEYGWRIMVPKVIVAVNGFAQQIMPGLAVQPARNQVLITQPIPGLPVEGCFHYDRGYYYFRNIDGRILLGGGRNLAFDTEATDQFGSNEFIRSALVQLLKTVICPGRHIEIDTWWSGILGLGPVKKPIVEKASQNVVLALRLSGMGVAIGTLVGQEGAELVG